MKISLDNNLCSLTIDAFGGAITNFYLKDEAQINPLSFAFTKKQMPENNKNGAPYQGHFLCVGRWGLPSDNEIKKGVPNHGEAANINWKIIQETSNKLSMQTTAKLEGLHIERNIQLDENNTAFFVEETVTNINTLGRLNNIVQHPTLAAPFLDASTIINCNATMGFDQLQYQTAEKSSYHFPNVKDIEGNNYNLKNPQINYNAVYSFIVDENKDLGWLTAYSPTHNLLFGYVWKRSDYPWIHLWQHWSDDKLIYRGLEFGTAGVHQPYNEILNTATHLFGEKTFEYIDANESITKKYFSFLCKTKQNFTEVVQVNVDDHSIIIQTGNESLVLETSFNIQHELYK